MVTHNPFSLRLQLVDAAWIVRQFDFTTPPITTIKHGLAAYKSFEDYRLFDDGYVESLLTAQLN